MTDQAKTRICTWLRSAAVPGFVLLLVAAMAAPAAAQVGAGRVTGLVRDQATGAPMQGVQIQIEGTALVQLTGENGRYFFMNVPAGTYTLVAQVIGYATLRKENVLVTTDVARTADFDMTSQAVALQAVMVEADRVPLVDTKSTGSADVVTRAELDALPVREISEVLALQHGFFEPEYNTDLIGYLDQERGVTPLHVRGGRSGETIVMVDGIPVTNFMVGDAGFTPGTGVVEQVNYARGGFEAKYGNALSGVVNIRTREPRTYHQGTIQYETSGVGGALGSDYDDFRNYHNVDGNLSGPIPGTNNKLRFMVSGRNQEGAGRVLNFDDAIFSPVQLAYDERENYGSLYDLVPGWRSLGFRQSRDLMGKLGYYFAPGMKLEFSFSENQRQTKPYSFAYLQAGYDTYGQCVAVYPTMEDVCRRQYLGGIQPEKMTDLQRNTGAEMPWVLRNTVHRRMQSMSVNWDHTIGRLAYNIAAGRTEQERDSCTFLAGICLGPRMAKTYTNGPFISSAGGRAYDRHPIFGTSDYFGGDGSTSLFGRGDLEWQATDHHNISAGFFYQNHDITFIEGRDVGLNNVQLEWNQYAAKPWDAAVYVQDRIEYDFITVRLGMRLEYGRADGLFFVNPQDPTNGTTVYHVCENPASFGLPAGHFVHTDAASNETYTGITACALNGELMEEARGLAMQDDFQAARARRSLSPRLGVSFPITEDAHLFFNYGRFVQNPLLNNLYRMTAIGTPAEGTRDALGLVTNATKAPLLGNPHLLSEATSSYELGLNTQMFEGRYGASAVMYMKDQFGLTGKRRGGIDEVGRIIFDPGSTYGNTTYEYETVLNLDFQTARGVEFTLRRRLESFWAFDLRYSYSQVRTNAAPPEFELQKQLEEGDQPVRREIRSKVDRPHVASGVLRFQVGRNAPDIPFGNLLQNSSLSLTGRVSSGVPYTPQLDLEGSTRVTANRRLLRNSGTSPTVFTMNAIARKDFRHSNVRYGMFLQINNLLDRKNCARVFTTTGRCDGGAITQARLQVGSANTTGTISQSWDRPDYYLAPRSISAGVRVSF